MSLIIVTPGIARFRSSPVQVEALAAVLSEPTLKEALDLLEKAARPSRIPASIPGNHPDTAIAHEFYRQLGINQTLATLRAMSSKSPTPEEQDVGDLGLPFVPDDFPKPYKK